MNNLQVSNDVNKKISILELPAQDGSAVEYYIDAAYVGGVAANDLIDAISSAMVFRGTFTAVGEIPTPAAGVLGDVYKFVTDNKDGVAITLPGDSAATTLKRGDIVICAKADSGYRWAVVPAGDTDGVLEISKGTAIKLYNKAGNEVETLDREGSISVDLAVTDGHHHDIIFTGTHNHEFTGSQATISVTANPTGSVTLSKDGTASANSLAYTPEGSVSVTCKPAGEVTTTATEVTKTAAVSGALSSVTVDPHTIPYAKSVKSATFTGKQATINSKYTPDGDIEVNISGEAGQGKTPYTPEGTINDLIFTGTQETLNVANAVTNVEIPDHQTFNVVESATATFTGTQGTVNVGKYTPEGAVESSWTMTSNNHGTSEHKFTGVAATISSSGTAEVITNKNVVTDVVPVPSDIPVVSGVTVADTAEVYDNIHFTNKDAEGNPTNKLRMVFTKASAVTNVIATTGKITALTDITVTKEKVASSGTASVTSGQYTPEGSISTSALTISGSVDSEFTGVEKDLTTTYTPAGTVAVALTKTPITLTHAPELTTTGATVTHKPAGTITKPVFTGVTKYFSGEFTGTEGNATTTYTPEGDVTVVLDINTDPITHNVQTSDANVTATYKCITDLKSTFEGTTGTCTGTFTGTPVYFNAAFDGETETLSTTYTPAGTVEDTELTFKGETGNGCRQIHE